MKKIIAAAATAALALSITPAVTAAPAFGSSGSSLLGSSAPVTPEQEIRNAIEDSLEHRGYTIDPDLSEAAQRYVTSTGADRDQAYEDLFAAGMTSGDGGRYASNPELIIQQFPLYGDPQPDNGRVAAVGVDYGIATTEIMIFYGN